ncbi:hypothetical protein WJ0W_003838 [Paenibacillus melissococcoides]|uniref:N-acetyltransferase domain-containing protein n=1 Tax=Paenibacillus melissococcoides TaxID=2912268 RepID=A0ABM9G4F9_9BACL|nr:MULTISPECIES: hypothetical protein [Paenibacillus]MEB9895949.1 hypothetical protein [Bacillus cereus]CAH8246604.1 hypothetical protein WJ0W_003838 [Paenibacillus melissococcoides]CAH8715235.1 hypothetical protein HTL2_004207 [Paenibacillus melissococcoides]CAH8716166.1 hypothetical protein WDD9_004474 [Paenibacillus melissococcoides]GIO80064.1 hypothetical protein J6TS7_36740 [Paenibacillus dendritiformis]
METHENLQFQSFLEEDVAGLTEIMTRAYDTDTKQFLGRDKGRPDGYDTGEFITRWAINSSAQSYKVLLDEKLIGSVIVWINENNENILGCLFVDPLVENRGAYGVHSKLWYSSYMRLRQLREASVSLVKKELSL